MALDLTALGSNHDKSSERKIKIAVAPLASILTHFDDHVRIYGLEEMEGRIKAALPILQGKQSGEGSNQLSEQLSELGERDRKLVLGIISGQFNADGLANEIQQGRQAQQDLQHYQSGHQVDALSPSQALSTAISDSVKLATDADLLSGEIEALEKDIHEQTEKLEGSFPADNEVAWIKLGRKGTIELHKATSEIAAKQVELDKKTAELAVISKKLVESTAAAQTALNDLASSGRNNGSQSSAGPLALGF